MLVSLSSSLTPLDTLQTLTPLESATADMIYPAPHWSERRADYTPYKDPSDAAFVVLGLVGAAMCLVFIILLIIWRKKPQIMASQLELVLLILIGALAAFISVPMWTLTVTDGMCIAQHWLLVIGLDLFLGPLLVKNWRIYSLFQAALKLKRNIIPLPMLFGSTCFAGPTDPVYFIALHSTHLPLRLCGSHRPG